jgi:hypothetical protein
MKGMIPKRIVASTMQCSKCLHFCDDDPDVFYCDLDHDEFPGLCKDYKSNAIENFDYMNHELPR